MFEKKYLAVGRSSLSVGWKRWWGAMLVALLLTALAACGSSGNGNISLPEGVPTQAVAINVLSALVTPAFSLDSGGGPVNFPASEYNDGNFMLRGDTPATASDVVPLGSSHDNNPPAVRVVQGDYDVLYQHETGDSVPQNRGMPVQTGVDITNVSDPFPVAVTAWAITPTFLLNGGAFPVSEYDDGVFYLQPTAGGERIFLGNSHTPTLELDNVLVMPGSYDVIYVLETAGDIAPNNQNAVVMSGVDISTDRALVVDVPTVAFVFDASLDSGAFPSSPYQAAKFFLRNSSGDRVALGASFELPVTVSVIKGVYDIVYQHIQGNQLPVNTDAIVVANLLVGTAGTNGGVATHNVDIASVAITPAFTLDGADFPATEYSDANFYLRGANNKNDVAFLGASEIASSAVRVISSDFDTGAGAGVVLGAYDILYRHESGSEVPQNSNALVLSGVVLNSDMAPLAVPVTSVDVAGMFTLNGNNFPGDASDSVRFFLRGDESDDVFLFAYSDLANNEPVKLVSMPGSYDTYDVMMDHLAGDAVPQNEMHEVDFNNVLDVDKTLQVNIPAVRVDPSFSLDGAAFPVSIYQSATFYLRDIHTGRRIFLGHSYKNNDPVMVIKEDHEIIYEHTYGDQVPQNRNKLLQVVDL